MTHSGSLECLNIARQGCHLKTWKENSPYHKGLAWYNINIATLSETRLADKGMLREAGAGYTFFWWGKPADEDRLHGVRLAIRTSLMEDIPSQPFRINECLKKLHLPLNRTCHVTIISTYAPTLTSPDEAKKQFYKDHGHLIKVTPSSNKLIIMGDFNARVGKVSNDWKAVLGSYVAYVMSTCCASPTPSSIKLTSTNQPGCIQDPSSGTWLILLLLSRETSRMWGKPVPCTVLNTRQTTEMVRSILELHIALTSASIPNHQITI